MTNYQLHGAPYSITATGTTSATATRAAVPGATHLITDFQASTDKAASTVVIRRGSTIIWRVQIATAGAVSHSFVSPLAGLPGEALSIEVDGTAACMVNVAGFTI